MYENPETLTEARIKIRDLENELALCNTRIIQCEKEKRDLTTVIEELHEKFIHKPLENLIDQLESNLSLFIGAVGDIEPRDNEESPSSENHSEIAIIEDTDYRSQIETTCTEDTNKPLIILNSYSISLSNDSESTSDDQDPVENETSVNADDLLAEIKESLKRISDGVDKVCDKMSNVETNLTTTPGIRDDEIFTIDCDEDNFNSADNRPVSRPTIPPVIELDDSSCESDPDDCVLLTDDLITDQQKANPSSDVFETSPLVDDESWVFPLLNDSNNDEQVDDSSDHSKTTSVESEFTSDEQPSYRGISQKSILNDLGDLFTENINSNHATCSTNCSENISINDLVPKSTLSNGFEKPTTSELLDLLIENDTINDAAYPKINEESTNNLSTEIADNSGICSKINPEKNSNYDDSPELTLAELDDVPVPSKTANSSDIAEYELDKLSIVNFNPNSTLSKICQENTSAREILPESTPNDLSDLSTRSPNPNLMCSKISQEETSFSELSCKSTISDFDYSSTGNPNFISSTPISNQGNPVFSNVLEKSRFDKLNELSSEDPSSDPTYTKISQEDISSNEVLPKSTHAELGNTFFENANLDVASCSKINDENTASSEISSESTLDDPNDSSNKIPNPNYTYSKISRRENAFAASLDNFPAESSKRNTLFSDVLQKPTFDKVDDLSTVNLNADRTCSKISQEKISSREVLPKSTLAELDDTCLNNLNFDAVSCTKTSQEKSSPIEVVPKPILAELTNMSAENSPYSKTSQKKPSLSDDSPKQITADSDDLSTESIKPDSAKCSKINEEKTSSIEVPSKLNFNELDGLSTESIYLASAKISKTSQENSFAGVLQKLRPVKFDDSSIPSSAEIDLPGSDSEAVGKYVINDEEISTCNNLECLTVIEWGDSTSTDLCEETFSISDHSTDSPTKIDRGTSPIKFELKKDPYEFNDSSTEVQHHRKNHSLSQSTKMVKLPQNDDSNSPACSTYKQNIKFFKEKPESDTEYETNPRKRAKYDIYGSYISPAELLFSSNSTSAEELGRKKMLSWPCPICDECFTNPNFYSKHLNRAHIGEKGVFTCSICQFVSPSISAHKKHVNKWHADAFLMENRYRYVHHIIKDHPYAKTNFNS